MSGVSTNSYIPRDASASYITNYPEKNKRNNLQQNSRLSNIKVDIEKF